MPTERCRENKRPIHTWPHPMSWPCHCPCPVQVTVAVTEFIIRMVWCMSRHTQPSLNFILSWQYMFIISFYNCSWYCWYLCGACIGSELLYLETFKLGWCCLGIFASIHHQSKGSMQSNVSISVTSCWNRPLSDSNLIVFNSLLQQARISYNGSTRTHVQVSCARVCIWFCV